MAKLTRIDLTLAAADKALEAKQSGRQREYLGVSSLGKECERSLWYAFRHAKAPQFSAATLKRFADGFAGEDLQAKRLRMVPRVTLHTHDPNTGEQFGFSELGGHLKGHMDGAIVGLLHDPRTWHVWEHKQVDNKKFDLLNKLIADDPDSALEKWDEVYFCQAVMYMHLSSMERHYLTCSTPGGRDTTAVVTKADPARAESLMVKAKRIISAQDPPERISEDSCWYQCKWCEFSSICHETEVPDPGCRSCCHATPAENGGATWHCAKWQTDITKQRQMEGCELHLYIPSLLKNFASVEDANENVGWIEYSQQDGRLFKNGQSPDCFTSKEIHDAKDKRALCEEGVMEIRQLFDAKIVG